MTVVTAAAAVRAAKRRVNNKKRADLYGLALFLFKLQCGQEGGQALGHAVSTGVVGVEAVGHIAGDMLLNAGADAGGAVEIQHGERVVGGYGDDGVHVVDEGSARVGGEVLVVGGLEGGHDHDACIGILLHQAAEQVNAEDIRHLMELLLLEFPIRRIDVELPAWTTALDGSHWLRNQLESAVFDCARRVRKLGELGGAFNAMFDSEYVRDAMITAMDCGTGVAELEIRLTEPIYYKVISELTGITVEDEEGLINRMKDLSAVKVRYDKIQAALDEVEANGYGIVMPSVEDLKLEEPKIIRKSGSYGVRLRAAAPSVHMIKANIETEINPIVGTEQQSEDLIRYLMSEFDEDPTKIWSSKLFGKTLYELMTEGLHTKLENMPDDARKKLGETLERIVNEGSGGLICILL